MRGIVIGLAYGLGCALAGCTNGAETVDLSYRLNASAPLFAGAERVEVAILARDARAEYRDRISTKKNGRGMDSTPITANQDVAALVRGAVAIELAQRGFGTNGRSDGLSIVIEVATFYSEFRFSFSPGDSVARVAFNVRVQAPDGRGMFERRIVGRTTLHAVPFATADEAKRAIEMALSDAVGRLMAEPQFLSALIAA